MLEKDWGVRNSLGHTIPENELDRKAQEIKEVLNLLERNRVVILTAERNIYGKSTFGRILRHKILTELKDATFSDCIFMRPDQIEISLHEPRRQDRFTTYDTFSYPHLIRFQGLIIFDEVYPEYVPRALTMKKAKLLLIVQPNFLEGPPFDDKMHEEFVSWIKEKNVPIYKLKPPLKPAFSNNPLPNSN